MQHHDRKNATKPTLATTPSTTHIAFPSETRKLLHITPSDKKKNANENLGMHVIFIKFHCENKNIIYPQKKKKKEYNKMLGRNNVLMTCTVLLRSFSHILKDTSCSSRPHLLHRLFSRKLIIEMKITRSGSILTMN